MGSESEGQGEEMMVKMMVKVEILVKMMVKVEILVKVKRL